MIKIRKIAYILSAAFIFSYCQKKEDNIILNINVITKEVTDIKGNIAIGHGSIMIDNSYELVNDYYVVRHNKNSSFYLSIKGKGIIVSADSSRSQMQIASNRYHGIEGFFDSGEDRYFEYSYRAIAAKSKVYIPTSMYGRANDAFGCYMSDLQFNTKYYARTFAHITYGTNKRDYVYESH